MGDHGATVAAWTDCYNKRDFAPWLSHCSEDVELVDLSQGVRAKGHDEVMAYGQGWINAFSDARYEDRRITEAGDVAVMQFNGVGTHDGQFGALAPTGKPVRFPVMNVITFNGQGQISRVEQLYDRLDILTQLGQVPA
jgi:predicted ester cyclase